MAALTTATKAPLIVHTAAGVFVGGNSQTLTFDPEGIAAKGAGVDIPNLGTCWYIVGLAVGSTVLTVSGAGSSATLPIAVAAAPLDVMLGDPVPR